MAINFDSNDYFNKVEAWWRAANYISVGQIYLKDNPLLREEISKNDLKVNTVGHWGTAPGQNFIYAHLNRVIKKYDLDMFYIEGPGHAAQVMVANSYLDGSYSEIYPEITQNTEGLSKLFKSFSFPGGIGSHAAPETPGSFHEGGELGYSLSHGTGAILDQPDTIAATVIGDGEAETGPLSAGWFSNTFINPVNDGAVLPILHLNGAKIANPTILGRKTDEELTKYFEGMGWDPYFVEGDDSDHMHMHSKMAKTLDTVIERIQKIQRDAREDSASEASMPAWPVLVVRTPKGWTGPENWEDERIEGTFRSHQVPLPIDANNMEDVNVLIDWMKSYRPEELFTEEGELVAELKEIAPKGKRRMARNPLMNGGENIPDLALPNWEGYTIEFDKPGNILSQDMLEFGKYARDIVKNNPHTFRVFGPDENDSNRLGYIFDVTDRQWLSVINENIDEDMEPAGRVIDSQLSEHQAEGMLEGYVLTGRYGFFASYEAFLRIVESMINQHFKWIRKADELEWRNPYQSLNLIVSSYAFQQDHNGYTHQDPGILTVLAEKKPKFIREYLPADTNTLLAVMDKVFNSKNRINLVVASKEPRLQFYSEDEAKELVENGLKIIDWASTAGENEEPDLVMAAAGTEPNLETLAAIELLYQAKPDLKIRFVNVVDLLKIRHQEIDERGLSDEQFHNIFTANKPILFAFHGYEGLIRDIFFRRNNTRLFIHGYREEGDITTEFDMRVYNNLDRFHLAQHAVEIVYGEEANDFVQEMEAKLNDHHNFITENGYDLPEIENWKWQGLN